MLNLYQINPISANSIGGSTLDGAREVSDTGVPMNEPRINIPEWTVSELSAALKRTVEDSYGQVRVRGEISGYRGAHSSGHAYFALKDAGARIEAVIWKSTFGRMRIRPEDGLEVIATGRLTTFPGRSTYQIVIDTLEPAGLGALMALLEQRKKKLAAEGLFDEARKQLLPYLPDVIGVVTSASGAVIRDILHRLADRFPRRVLVWPVRVQGDGAAEEVAAAIHGFNALPQGAGAAIPRPDLLIVARGGGSIEDLWAFNEEIVVRAAAASLIPLISAVGHETDVTLIDFVADRRAPTPTAAAEIAVPVKAELISRIAGLTRRALACWARGQDGRRTELRAAVRALPSAEALLALPRQRLDAVAERLPRALIANAQVHHAAYSRLAARLAPQMLRIPISRNRERLTALAGRAERSMRVNRDRRRDRFTAASLRLAASLRANAAAHRSRIAREHERIAALMLRAERAALGLIDRRLARLDRAGQLLAALSYHGVLARGFALVRGEGGVPVRAAAAVTPAMRLDIEFADGRVSATAEGAPRLRGAISGATPSRARRRRSTDPDQGTLF
jgi:exodeoxyribonuclease VII large subunit